MYLYVPCYFHARLSLLRCVWAWKCYTTKFHWCSPLEIACLAKIIIIVTNRAVCWLSSCSLLLLQEITVRSGTELRFVERNYFRFVRVLYVLHRHLNHISPCPSTDFDKTLHHLQHAWGESQSFVKFYSLTCFVPTMSNVVKVADRLFSSFGQDILDALFLTATESKKKRETFKLVLHLILAVIYVCILCCQELWVQAMQLLCAVY